MSGYPSCIHNPNYLSQQTTRPTQGGVWLALLLPWSTLQPIARDPVGVLDPNGPGGVTVYFRTNGQVKAAGATGLWARHRGGILNTATKQSSRDYRSCTPWLGLGIGWTLSWTLTQKLLCQQVLDVFQHWLANVYTLGFQGLSCWLKVTNVSKNVSTVLQQTRTLSTDNLICGLRLEGSPSSTDWPEVSSEC